MTTVTVDVVDLHRVERLSADLGAALERRLLHPVECDRVATLHGAGKVRALAAALATKEAWIKSRGGRPAGWTFARAAFVPEGGQERPEVVQELVGRFVDDLGVTEVEAGVVYDGAAGSDDRWAWHGIHDHWLISAVLA